MSTRSDFHNPKHPDIHQDLMTRSSDNPSTSPSHHSTNAKRKPVSRAISDKKTCCGRSRGRIIGEWRSQQVKIDRDGDRWSKAETKRIPGRRTNKLLILRLAEPRQDRGQKQGHGSPPCRLERWNGLRKFGGGSCLFNYETTRRVQRSRLRYETSPDSRFSLPTVPTTRAPLSPFHVLSFDFLMSTRQQLIILFQSFISVLH